MTQTLFPDAITTEEAFGSPTLSFVFPFGASSYAFSPILGTKIDPTDSVTISMIGTNAPAGAWMFWLSLSAGFGGFYGFGGETFGFGLPTDPLRGREQIVIDGVVQPGWTVNVTVVGPNDLDIEISRNIGWPAVPRIIQMRPTESGSAGSISAPVVNIQTYVHPVAIFDTVADVGRSILFASGTVPANEGVFTVLTVPSNTTITYTNAGGVAQPVFDGFWTIGVSSGASVSVTLNGSPVTVFPTAGDDPVVVMSALLAAITGLAIPNLIAESLYFTRAIVLMDSGFVSLAYSDVLLDSEKEAQFAVWDEPLLDYGGYYPYNPAWAWAVLVSIQPSTNGDDLQSLDGIGVNPFISVEDVVVTTALGPTATYRVEGFGCGELDTASYQGVQPVS